MPISVDFVGTVSKGSMYPEELIKTFMAFLDYYWPERAEEFRWDFPEVFTALQKPENWVANDWQPPQNILRCAVHLVYGEIWDALNELAPAGYKFCENPKDFTDFGYWAIKEEKDV